MCLGINDSSHLKMKLVAFLLKSKRSETEKKIAAAKNGYFYSEGFPYCSHNGSMINGVKKLYRVCV